MSWFPWFVRRKRYLDMEEAFLVEHQEAVDQHTRADDLAIEAGELADKVYDLSVNIKGMDDRLVTLQNQLRETTQDLEEVRGIRDRIEVVNQELSKKLFDLRIRDKDITHELGLIGKLALKLAFTIKDTLKD